jgi:hypothetical protein
MSESQDIEILFKNMLTYVDELIRVIESYADVS